MRSLEEIKQDNQQAVATGVVAAGTVVVPRYDVYHHDKKIKTNATLAECADLRSIQDTCKFVRVDN